MLKITISVLTKLGNSFEIEAPAKRIVCPSCEGRGTELRASLRGVAFSAEEMDEDPEFRENYFSGRYDVLCSECQGSNVVIVVDEERLTPKMRDRYWRYLNQRAADAAEAAWERQYC